MREFISRILAGPIGGAIVWLAGKGVDLGPNAEAITNDFLTMVAAGLLMSAYGVVHRAIDRKVNPADVAKSGPIGRPPV